MRFRKDAIVLDSETLGFHGLAILLQWAEEDGPVHLYNLWDVPVRETIELIEMFMQRTLVMFNSSFDHFHLCKLYTMWLVLQEQYGPGVIPIQLPLDALAQAEKDARDGPCLKPKDTMDLMLHSRKGEFQSLMSRHAVRVTKVPTPLAEPLRNILEGLIEFDGILFAGRANPNAPKWGVYDRIKKGKEDTVDENFKDITLKFRPARGLKYLAQHCLGLNPEFHSFKDIYPSLPGKLFELGYTPFALGVSSAEKDWKVYDKTGKLKGQAWPAFIKFAVDFWRENEEARRYARDDVVYTRLLDEYFGFPESGDTDSVLACMVAAVRWHGFVVDTDAVARLHAKSKRVLEASPVNINKPTQVKRHIREVMAEEEAVLIDKSTKKANLEKIRADYVVMADSDDFDPDLGPFGGETCVRCFDDESTETCPRCEGRGYLPEGPTLASKRADEILKCKTAAKEVELYTKLLKAGRFHAAFKVIGTLSSRMAGGEGLNAQGIKNSAEVRGAFPLKWPGMVLCGGDFDGFEVTIADAVFGDAKLRANLLAGISIHTMMAEKIYPDKTRDQIKASKGFADGGDVDMYTRGKQAVFATLYGGDASTINKKLSIPKKIAEEAFDAFQEEYPGIKKTRDEIAEQFQALEQHGEVGAGHISYKKPDDYIETFLGFRRYFTLENKIAKALYDLAHNTPVAWRKLDWKVVRRNREQSPAGAISSALYGAAFQIQASTIRAANNHLIQSPGAMITKQLQRNIWDVQPHGVNAWRVAPINVHDEVLSVTAPDAVEEITEITVRTVESFRDRVPLIGMDWIKSMDNWAGKKGGEGADLWSEGVLALLGENPPNSPEMVSDFNTLVTVTISPHGIEGWNDEDTTYVEPLDAQELDELDEEDDPCPESSTNDYLESLI